MLFVDSPQVVIRPHTALESGLVGGLGVLYWPGLDCPGRARNARVKSQRGEHVAEAERKSQKDVISAGEIDAENRVITALGIPHVTLQTIAELVYGARLLI